MNEINLPVTLPPRITGRDLFAACMPTSENELRRWKQAMLALPAATRHDGSSLTVPNMTAEDVAYLLYGYHDAASAASTRWNYNDANRFRWNLVGNDFKGGHGSNLLRWCAALRDEGQFRYNEYHTKRALQNGALDQPAPTTPSATSTQAPFEAAPPAQSAPPAQVTRSAAHVTGQVNEAKAAEARELDIFLSENNFTVAKRLFADGTATMACADDTYRGYAKEWSDLPLTRDGLAEVEQSIKAEVRQLYQRSAADIRFDLDTGRPVVPIGGLRPAYLEEQGFKQLLDMLRTKTAMTNADGKPVLDKGQQVYTIASLFPGAVPFLGKLRPDTLVETLNRHIRDNKDALDPHTVALRTRVNAKGERALYMVSSPTYADFDIARSCKQMAEYLTTLPASQEARGIVTYDPTRLSFTAEASFFREHISDISVGDAFRTGLYVRNNDGKGGGIEVVVGLTRVRCINLTTVEDKMAHSMRHSGDMNRIAAKVKDVHNNAARLQSAFLAKWGQLKDAPIKLGRRTFETVPDAIEYGVDSGVLALTTSKKADKAALIEGFGHEPGTDMLALVNAVTRAVQMDRMLDDITADVAARRRLDAAALSGQLVMSYAA